MKTRQQITAAKNFLIAFNALRDASKETSRQADRNLDKALNAYRKAFNLSSAFGFLDCVNHYNQNFAS
jgi:hypothetical protein